ncbi:uncharacterized protein LOC126847636 isoform X2 [Adelges cooleyi]|uniref:uncharacterized protein LOC126847636 isoform X2 n=1 Tax=Adelges cooleyi TaxID=133065 RepID=UPI002180888F|nr:uncharacterized protein LOC126847636 isoform X2 [Adelges cooleyi]
MQFKIAVILCALYFVTMTQSIGLNIFKVRTIIDLFKKHKSHEDQVSPDEINEIFKNMGVQDMTGFTYEADMKDGRKVQSVMVFLAKNNKTFDHWMIQSLSTHEVTIYLSLFRNHEEKKGDADGLVNSEKFQNIIQALSLNDEEKKSLADYFEGYSAINFAEFLYGFLKVKPLGRGLNVKQIVDLNNIKDHKINADYIQPDKLTEFIKGLSIVKDQDEEWVFERFQTAAFELQELMVFSAEYNQTDNAEVETVCNTIEVRRVLATFVVFDKDHDGLLNGNELEKMALEHFSHLDVKSILKDGVADADKSLDIVDLFMVIYKVYDTNVTNE